MVFVSFGGINAAGQTICFLAVVSWEGLAERSAALATQTLDVPGNFVTIRCNIIVFHASVSENAFPDASGTAANELDAK
jgi:hypothetical protein